MTTVAVYGGSFNPPHVSHVLAPAYAMAMGVDMVLVVPAFRHPFAKDLAPFEDRLRLCRKAFSWNSGVQVSDAERHNPEGRTLDLLRGFKSAHLEWDLRLLIGADIIGECHKWHRFDLVCEIAPPMIMGRPGFGPLPEWARGLPMGPEMPKVSSTDVRAALASGDEAFLASHVPAGVLKDIMVSRLYGWE